VVDLRRRFALSFLFLWILFSLYPDPALLIKSVWRIFYPPVQPEAVVDLLEGNAFDDPAEMENFVLREIPYVHDWESYGVPWYFPTVTEVLEKRTGDCKSRFIVLASSFERMGVDYGISLSPTHIWAEYDGKAENITENRRVAFYEEEGFRLPQIDIRRSFEVFYRAFWETMPLERKILLLQGTVFFLFVSFLPQPRTKGGIS